MLPLLKIGAALFLFLVGWCHLYKPAWILRANAWCRDVLLNDSVVLLARWKIGLACVILSSLMFYSGFSGLSSKAKMGPRIEREGFQQAQKAFQAKRYNGAIARCQSLIRENPDHVDAWQLLGSCWLAMGKEVEARKAWERVLVLDPNNAVGKSRLVLDSAVKQ